MSSNTELPQTSVLADSRILGSWKKEVATFIVVVVSPLICAWRIYGLSVAKLSEPWAASGDLLTAYAFAQSRSFGVLGFKNPVVGAPFFLDYRFEAFDVLNGHLVVFLAKLFGSPFMGVNVFHLLSFSASAATFYIALQKIGGKRHVAAPLAIAYSLLPYTFYRMTQGHVALAGYWALPLGILAIYKMRSLLELNNLHHRSDIVRLAPILTLAVVSGSSVVYYGVFLALICLATCASPAISACFRHKSAAPLVGLGLFVCSFLLMQVLLYVFLPSGGTTIVRTSDESLVWGGHLYRILLPWIPYGPQHLEDLVQIGFQELEWSGVSVLAWLGLMLSVAASRNAREMQPETQRVIRVLRMMIMAAILFYVAGGLGYVFSVLITPEFRCWNRMSIVIETLSLLLLGIVLSNLKFAKARKALTVGVLALIVVFTQLAPVRELGVTKEPDVETIQTVTNTKSFLSVLRKRVPAGCSILQLPMMDYPEGGRVGDVMSGDHFLLSLLAPEYRWSYSISKFDPRGRFWVDGDSDEIQKARSLGFCAVVFDKRGVDATKLGALGPIIGARMSRYLLFVYPN